MVFLLVDYVLNHIINFRPAVAESAVTILPLKFADC